MASDMVIMDNQNLQILSRYLAFKMYDVAHRWIHGWAFRNSPGTKDTINFNKG